MKTITHEEELAGRWQMMAGERRTHENAWQDICDMGLPYRGDFNTQRTEGAERMVGVFDTTLMTAIMDYSNFIKSIMLPTNTVWLKWRPGRTHRENLRLRMALDATSDRMLEAFEECNFYVANGNAIRDMVSIGNQSMHVDEKEPRLGFDGNTFGGFHFHSIPMRRVWWRWGSQNEVSMIVREIEQTVLDVLRRFGERASSALHDKMDAGKAFEKTCYLHFVWRNERSVRSGLRSSAQRPWLSEFVEGHSGDAPWAILERGGYEENPYVSSRYMVVDGEEYGRGPGHVARADAKTLNEGRRKVLNAADYDLDSPLVVEGENVVDLDIGPGGITQIKPATQNMPTWLNSGTRYDVANEIFTAERDQINRAMMIHAIRGKETQPRSAQESALEFERDMRQLASTADVFHQEFLTPLMNVCMSKMLRAGALPELEEAVRSEGGELSIKPVFVSPFFTAQKAGMVNNVYTYVLRQVELFNQTQDPGYLIDIHPERVSKYASIESDIPAEVLRTQEEVSSIKEAQAQQQEEAEALRELEVMSKLPAPAQQSEPAQ